VRRSLFWLLDHYPETGESLASLTATALAHARLADRLGFTGLWLAEHHFQMLGTAPNPAVVLAAIAQCTERLRLGPAVSVLPLRDPILVAEDYALLDLLSGGRLDMGVGCGSQPLEFAGMGRDFERRRESFDQQLATLRRRWSAAAAGERGPGALNVAPLQSPAPPIFVAAMQEESAHAAGLAGHSLLTLVSPMTREPSEVAGRLAAHARGLAEGGRPEGSAERVVVAFAHVAACDDEAQRVAAPAMARLVQAMVGAAPPDPDDLYQRMRERDVGLFGSAEHVEEQIGRWAQVGVDHLAFVSRFGGMNAEAAARSLRALAPAA
jgi:alkanesulfonate monooxygenase SsuD/methylene tetrahydromethanopterin reductase-like flavin-dependent oxidoreductase (luciferase family)